MANGNGITFTSSYTGKEMLNPATNKPFQTLNEYLVYMDGDSSAKKTANKIIETTETADKPSENNPFGYNAANLELKKSGDTPGSLSKKQTETAAKGAGKSLDQFASEYAESKIKSYI